MGYSNPDYYYHKLIMDLTVEKSELKNQVIRLKKQLNQIQKDLKKWLQQSNQTIKQFQYVILTLENI